MTEWLGEGTMSINEALNKVSRTIDQVEKYVVYDTNAQFERTCVALDHLKYAVEQLNQQQLEQDARIDALVERLRQLGGYGSTLDV